jgi:hypothetical protein
MHAGFEVLTVMLLMISLWSCDTVLPGEQFLMLQRTKCLQLQG